MLYAQVCELSPLVPRVEKSDSLRCPISGAAIFYGLSLSVCNSFAYALVFDIAAPFGSEVSFAIYNYVTASLWCLDRGALPLVLPASLSRKA